MLWRVTVPSDHLTVIHPLRRVMIVKFTALLLIVIVIVIVIL